MDKPGAINFAIKVKAKTLLHDAKRSPCEFRTASFAWYARAPAIGGA